MQTSLELDKPKSFVFCLRTERVFGAVRYVVNLPVVLMQPINTDQPASTVRHARLSSIPPNKVHPFINVSWVGFSHRFTVPLGCGS